MLRTCAKILLLILLLMTLFPFKSEVSAAFSISNVTQNAESFLKAGEENAPLNETALADMVLPIGQTLTAVGVFIVVGALIIIGIKYITADPNTQASLKRQLVGLAISAVVIFGAYNIWVLVYNILDNAINK